MKLETLGHAGMLLTDDGGGPVLLTDPWLAGPAYWCSWWLQNEPSREKIEQLAKVEYVYITHEHPDHFHPASLRELGQGPRYLCPDLPENGILEWLQNEGVGAEALRSLQWRSLTHDVRVLSVPLWNDDSVLLVDTPEALIVNLNDAKPPRANLKQLRVFIDRNVAGERPTVLLSSYSPASIVNCFVRDSERVSMKTTADYARRTSDLCDLLGADWFMPFASQVVFRRTDSDWANAFSVTLDDLEREWRTPARLLPPFSTLDLDTGDATHIEPERYREVWRDREEEIAAQQELDETVAFTDADMRRLEAKMRSARLLAMALFPFGIGFRIRDRQATFRPWSGRLVEGRASGHVVIEVPAAPMKDALEVGHFGDLGIPMFTVIHLTRWTLPAFVYLLFITLTLGDYGHLGGVRGLRRWLASVLRNRRWDIPDPSDVATPGSRL